MTTQVSVFAEMVAEYTRDPECEGRPRAADSTEALEQVAMMLGHACKDLREEQRANGSVQPWQVLSALVSIAAACEMAAEDLGLTRDAEMARRAGLN